MTPHVFCLLLLPINHPSASSWGACPLAACHAKYPAAMGQGISVLYASSDVPPEMVSLSRQLMGAVGDVADLKDETLMDAVTALSGSGPAYVFAG